MLGIVGREFIIMILLTCTISRTRPCSSLQIFLLLLLYGLCTESVHLCIFNMSGFCWIFMCTLYIIIILSYQRLSWITYIVDLYLVYYYIMHCVRVYTYGYGTGYGVDRPDIARVTSFMMHDVRKRQARQCSMRMHTFAEV